MSQHLRRALAALGLMAVLLFVAPAPSQAAGLREIPVRVPGIAARVWTWLEGWLPPPILWGDASARKTKQGSALDPNGSTTTSPTSGSTSDQGSALDPNGGK